MCKTTTTKKNLITYWIREMCGEVVFSEERSVRACTEVRGQRSEENGLCSFFFSKYLSLYFSWQRRTVKEDPPMGQQGKHQEIILEAGRESSGRGRARALTLVAPGTQG